MAAKEVIRKWQGKQELPTDKALRDELRKAFAHPTVGLLRDFNEGSIYAFHWKIYSECCRAI